MRLKLLLIAVVLFVGFGRSYGQIATFNFPATNSTFVSSNNVNVTVSNITLSAGTIETNITIGAYFPNEPYIEETGGWTATTQATAKNLTFTITPSVGYVINITNISFRSYTTAAGPSAVGFAIGSTDIYSINSPDSELLTVNQAVSGQNNLSSAVIKIQGWLNDSRTTSGGGAFRLDDIIITGTVTPAGIISAQTGNWSDTATWVGSNVPTSADNAIILSGHTVTMDNATYCTRNMGTFTTVNTGGTLATNLNYINNGTTTVNGSFQLNSGGWVSDISGTNAFIYGSNGSLIFNAPYIANSGNYWPATNGPVNVTVNSGSDLTLGFSRTVSGTFQTAAAVNFPTSTLTLNGIARINTGGFFNQSPIFGSASTLIYNTGGTYGRGNEWQALGIGTIGTTPGYPNNILLSGNTTLNYNNGTPLAKAINGNLSIYSGSSFYMDFGGGASGGQLTVAGNVTNNGNFTLGNTVGDDLKLGSNFTNTGTFNGNNRAIFFTKAGTQIVTSLSGVTIPYVVFSGGTTVQLATGTNMLISAPNEGNAISFTNSSDVFDINVGNTLTIGTATKANSIFGPGTFKGSTSSNLTILGTGSIGTLKFANDLNLGTFIMNRQAATVGCTMGSAVTINAALNLTNGMISLGNFDMSLGLTTTHTGSANGFVISDPDVGTGKLTKRVNSFGAYTLHIGENTAPNGTQYAPATINFSSGTFSPNAYYGVQVKDFIHPNIDSPTDYLTKYWIITSSGTFDTTVYSFTGVYTSGTADINGTESNCISAKWDGSKWTNGSAIGGGTLTISGLTKMATSTTNEISAGNRNREINIKGLSGAGNNIVSGGVTANGLNNTLFAATSIGSSATKDYEIQNLGIAALNLTGTPLVSIGGTNPGDFTVTTIPLTPIIGGSSTTFIITFSPTYAGVRTAIVSIANNDSDENPYIFLIQGTGNCSISAINTVTPTSGPVGTEVTITATANNLTGATVSFSGVAATSITYVSSTQIKVIVPSGATSGNLVTTNATGCQATNTFTTIDNKANSCQGGTVASDLFISEVTDASTGGLTYIEIYNGTGSTVNLSTYHIDFYNNGSLTQNGGTVPFSNVNLLSGNTFTIAVGVVGAPYTTTCSGQNDQFNGTFANLSSGNSGVNFNTGGENDHIKLYKGATQIDSWGLYNNGNWANGLGIGTEGVSFKRKNTVAAPNTTYLNNDWDITDWNSCSSNDYSDIGTYNFISGTPPTVTIPSYTTNCKTATLKVSGIEGYNGTSPADTQELTYQWLVSAPNATAWTDITNDANYSGSSTATLSIANISTIIKYQYYCQVRENTNTCYTASNAVKIIDGTITWNGTDWRDVNNAIATTSLSKLAVINANYDTTTNGDLNACSVIVNAGKILTVTSQKFVTIQNDLMINLTGKLEVLDKGSLVMINDLGTVTNNGITNIQRATTPFEKYDYTYWSTPIALDPNPTNIENTFIAPNVPNSTDWRIDNAYEFKPGNYMDADNDGFDDNQDDWSFVSSMYPGKGYIIMVPEQQITTSTPVNSALVIFSGKVNNGVVTTPVALTPAVVPAVADDDFNLVGNPYPSAISADAFINANLSTNGTTYNTIEGTLYFWTHKKDLSANNLGPDAFNYSQDDYAVYTLAGGTGTSGTVAGATEDLTNRPLGYIASGQGFFVEAVNAGTLVFNNSMRQGLPASANSKFYKSRPGKSKIISKDRIWLNLENSLGMFSQQLVGYFDNTTLGYDNGYDGLLSDAGNYIDFYSFIDDKTYKIQGRAAYYENDQVRLGYFSVVAGTFNINIDSKEGVFDNLSTSVYLEDKLLNVIYDLKQSPYTFTTEKGTFNDRFILRYTNKNLGITDLETLENQVLVSNKNKQIKVNSAVETIDKVLVYDLLGRQLFKKEKISGNELTIPNLVSSQQTLLVKVSLQNGQTVTKKIIF